MTEFSRPRQEYEIASLSADTRAILIGRGWECVGEWRWVQSSKRRDTERRWYRAYFDLSRPQVARIPAREGPAHWSPMKPIDAELLPDTEVLRRYVNIRARPSPAHEALPEDQGGNADLIWPYQYAPRGFISRAETEHRLLRGLKTSRQPGLVRHVETGFKSNWPVAQMVAGWGDYAPPITVRDFTPTRRDLDDWWIALSWFARLYPIKERPEDWRPRDTNVIQKILIWRSLVPAYSWRQIGDKLGRSNEWARRQSGHAIDRAWAIANEAERL